MNELQMDWQDVVAFMFLLGGTAVCSWLSVSVGERYLPPLCRLILDVLREAIEMATNKEQPQADNRPVEVDLGRLPPPDYYGVYWLGHPHTGDCPAIMPIQHGTYYEGKRREDAGGAEYADGLRGIASVYFASLGSKGVLWDGVKFKVFDTPHKAFIEIKKRLARG